eukprot:3266751-Prymnesium_polylepis.1
MTSQKKHPSWAFTRDSLIPKGGVQPARPPPGRALTHPGRTLTRVRARARLSAAVLPRPEPRRAERQPSVWHADRRDSAPPW